MAKKNKSGSKRRSSSEIIYEYHEPVLAEKVIENLVLLESGIYIDGTLGGGGHAARILQKLADGGKLLAFDKDHDAVMHSAGKLQLYLNDAASVRLYIYNEPFSRSCTRAAEHGGNIHGILLDLGVSSRQLDTGSIGLSYRVDAPLDMRFGMETELTAAEIINTYSVDQLIQILREFGEEPFAGPIARKIVERRAGNKFDTTYKLRYFIEEITPQQHHFKTLSRVFQALRIAVNGELDELKQTLNCILPLIATGGRIAIISYHSLEDRIVKNFFNDNEYIKPRNKYKAEEQLQTGVLKIITSKPITPSHQEIEQNPRSRSAKLRVAEKI